MFTRREDWDGDALFEARPRVSKKMVNRDQEGRSKSVDFQGVLVDWEAMGMYNMSNEDRRDVYK